MRTLVAYYVSFKFKEEPPISISVEGGKKLMEYLSQENPPKFVPIQDGLVAVSTIAKVIPQWKQVEEKEKGVEITPEQKEKNIKRMDEIRQQLFNWPHQEEKPDLINGHCKACDVTIEQGSYCRDCQEAL